MLGKLIKYDFRSCWKKFWPVWLALLILSAVNGIAYRYCDASGNYGFIMNALPKLLLGGVAMAAMVIAIIYIYNQFAHGLLGEQGYLMFTLPTTPEKLVTSKSMTALILEFISGAVAGMCAVIILFITSPSGMIKLISQIFQALSEYNNIGLIILFLAVVFILAVTTAVTFNFLIYTASAIGHCSSRHRSVVAILAFIGLCILSVFLITSVAVPLIYLIAGEFDKIAVYTWETDLWSSMAEAGVLILGEIVFSGIMFFAINRILTKHLNLE